MATSSKRAYATCYVTQVYCSQSPCPHGRPLLTCASAGDTQTLKGTSGSVSVEPLGPGAHKVLFEPSECLSGMGFDFKNDFTPPDSLTPQLVKNLPVMQETPVQFLSKEDSTGEGIGYPLQYS